MSQLVIVLDDEVPDGAVCSVIQDGSCLAPATKRMRTSESEGRDPEDLLMCGPHFVAAMVAVAVQIAEEGVN